MKIFIQEVHENGVSTIRCEVEASKGEELSDEDGKRILEAFRAAIRLHDVKVVFPDVLTANLERAVPDAIFIQQKLNYTTAEIKRVAGLKIKDVAPLLGVSASYLGRVIAGKASFQFSFKARLLEVLRKIALPEDKRAELIAIVESLPHS